jgi:hypothetical protein
MRYRDIILRTGIGLILVDDSSNTTVINAKRSRSRGIESLYSKIKILDIKTAETNPPHVAVKTVI